MSRGVSNFSKRMPDQYSLKMRTEAEATIAELTGRLTSLEQARTAAETRVAELSANLEAAGQNARDADATLRA